MNADQPRRSALSYGIVLMVVGLCGLLTAKLGDTWNTTESAVAVVLGWIFVFGGLAVLVADLRRRF